MGNLGFGEILLILVVVLLLFGSKRLPEVGRAMGQAYHEFISAVKGERKENQKGDNKEKEGEINKREG